MTSRRLTRRCSWPARALAIFEPLGRQLSGIFVGRAIVTMTRCLTLLPLVAVMGCASPKDATPTETRAGSGTAVADGVPLLRISQSDAACIRDLAAAIGFGDIDRLVEPEIAPLPSEDYCNVIERPQVIAPSITRHRTVTIVRSENTRYDGFKPATWISRCGWKASPAMINSYELNRIAVESSELDVLLAGTDPVTQGEAKAILTWLAEAIRSPGKESESPLSEFAIGDANRIERPIRVAHEIVPGIQLHGGNGHRLAEVYFSRSPMSGRTLVLCVEDGGVVVVGGTTWMSS